MRIAEERPLDAGSSQPSDPKEHASPFRVSGLMHFLGGLVHRHQGFWIGLGRLESSLLADELRAVEIRMPIFVCGLARSGSTLLHEVICSHTGVATHRIKDYPMVFTPYWWRKAAANFPPQAPRKRAHRDGMLITANSPDAIEEMVWMAFFPRCHDPSVCNVLRVHETYPPFESFYRTHIRKLLLAEGAARYAAKANYHVARLAYLVRLFPDAKIIVPVRAPAGHIASLMRQQEWFSRGEKANPRALALMRWSGHFEFGLDRRPMHLGNRQRVGAILRAWDAGEEVRGLALYWDMVYRYLAELLASDAGVRAAVQVIRFEDLCARPTEILSTMLEHCGLKEYDAIVAQRTSGIRPPDYYRSRFCDRDLAIIREETAATASLWGYEVA